MKEENNMAEGGEEYLSFDEDSELPAYAKSGLAPWRVLIVDDDEDVHRATEFAMREVAVLERPLQFLHAYAANEAIAMLREESDVAVILLDVVMESENAGLKAVGIIRDELKLTNPRIVLRTGQPGYAPEIETIRLYDINDYKTKNELTRSKLYTTLTAAIRSYDQLRRLDASRHGLELIVSASNQFICQAGVREFAEGVITQLAAFIGVEPDGMICARGESGGRSGECEIIATTGHFSRFLGHRLAEIDDTVVSEGLNRCLREKRSVVGDDHLALFFDGRNSHDFAAFINSNRPLRDIDEHLLEVFCANIAICNDNVHLVEQLRRLAYYDAQLKLPNRSYFVEAVDRHLARNDGHTNTLVLLDIDQFAEINDMLGHRYGDLLLFAIARRLEAQFGKQCDVARISNDIFGIFGNQSLVSPEALQSFFNTTIEIEGVERPVSLSAGLVQVVPGSNTDGALLLKDASIAVKRAKENGQGQYAFFSPEIAIATRERTRLLNDLRFAFRQDMLFVTYQPQLELSTGKVIGVEALMRWRTPEGIYVSPERFIPIAEQSGLIIGLGNWILRIALHAAKTLREAGFGDIRMAVNVSTNQFRQVNFIDQVHQALKDCGVAPEALELEITESVAVMGLSFVEDALRSLRQSGISVAIDDFGTGYSSLSYLGRLPANRLKIDHSFVWAMGSGRSDVNIPEMVIPLGRQLNMKVIAEGVETEEQARLLLQMGCDEVQGFLYAKPMSLEELLEWLRRRRAG